MTRRAIEAAIEREAAHLRSVAVSCPECGTLCQIGLRNGLYEIQSHRLDAVIAAFGLAVALGQCVGTAPLLSHICPPIPRGSAGIPGEGTVPSRGASQTRSGAHLPKESTDEGDWMN